MTSSPTGRFVRYPHPALAGKAECRPVDEALREVGQRLAEAAAEAGAYGLAAAHIGEVAPVIVLNVTPEATASYALFYNPRVVDAATQMAVGREASVSLSGVEVDVARAVWADIAFDSGDRTPAQQRFEGFVARCALHEIDQMNGRFFLANISRLKREMALKKAAKHAAG